MRSKHRLFIFTLLLAALSAGWAYMVADEDRLAQLEKGADVIFDRVMPA